MSTTVPGGRSPERGSLFANLPGMAYRCANDEHRTVVVASDGCCALTGYAPPDLIGNSKLCLTDLVHPGDRQWVRHNVLRSIATHERFESTYRIVTASGEVRWVQEHGVGLYDPDGACTAFEGFVCDITDFKQAQQRQGHLNAVLRSIRNVNQLILREKGDPERLIQGICDTMLATWGYSAVWISLFDKDGKPGLSARAGTAPEYQAVIDALRDGELPACGTVTNDEPFLHLVRAVAGGASEEHDAAHGSAIVARLMRGQHLYGMLCIVMSRELAIDAEEHVLLQELVNDIIFALHGLVQDRRRREAEHQVRWLARFPSENPNPVLRVSSDFRVLHANDAAVALLLRYGTGGTTVPLGWQEAIAAALRTQERRTLEVSCDDAVLSFTVAPVAVDAYVNLYGQDVTESRSAAERERRLADDMAFLSHTAMRFVEFGTEGDIEGYIAERVQEIVGEQSLILVTSNDWGANRQQTKAILGLEQFREHVARTLGFERLDAAVDLTPQIREAFSSGRLVRLEGGLAALLCPALPAEAVETFADQLDIHDVFAISFQRDSEIHGGLILATRDGPPARTELVEAFVRQASVALSRRRAEEALRETEQHLRQSQKMEAIGILAGGIAHDFNNVLSAIIGYTDLARSKVEPDSPVHRNLMHVLTAARRAAALVRQILTFSRHNQSERKPLDMALVVKEALKLLRPSLPATIEINSEVRTGLGCVEADPTQIHQVLMNLCTNAAYAMRGKHGTLSVALKRAALSQQDAASFHSLLPNDYIVLSVTDTGAGMDEQTKQRIFDPFFTTKPQGEGTGMGLAVVHGIVHGHGGEVRVESHPGQGSRFDVYLPVVGAEETTVRPNAKMVIRGGTERVLFVDDEELLAHVGRELLEELGYTVTAYTNSREALGAFTKAPDTFDVIVTDLTMPKMTGLQLATHCLAVRADIPIVLCTGNGQETTAVTAHDSGIREYVLKPLSKDALAGVVRRALDGAVLSSTRQDAAADSSHDTDGGTA